MIDFIYFIIGGLFVLGFIVIFIKSLKNKNEPNLGKKIWNLIKNIYDSILGIG